MDNPLHRIEAWTGAYFRLAELWEVGCFVIVPHSSGVDPICNSLKVQIAYLESVQRHNDSQEQAALYSRTPGLEMSQECLQMQSDVALDGQENAGEVGTSSGAGISVAEYPGNDGIAKNATFGIIADPLSGGSLDAAYMARLEEQFTRAATRRTWTIYFGSYSGMAILENAAIMAGEILETLWASLNKVSSQARTATLAHHAEILDDHMSDINWKKILNMRERSAESGFLCRKYQEAIVMHDKATTYHDGMTTTLKTEDRTRWDREIERAEVERIKDYKAMDIMKTRDIK
ncbi:hypothetical protein DXG01_001815 [Tephrocybe rancida]|nr:hypothetical protein DXG01_001815 [Tephrocybe rancida]